MTFAVTQVARWFAAVDAQDWSAVLALHASESLIVAGPQVLPRSVVDADLFGLVSETVAAVQKLPAWTWLGGDAVSIGESTVVTGQVAVAGDTERFAVGFGVAADGAIQGMVVDPKSAATVAREAAADLSQLPPTFRWQDAYPTALHHSYARRRIGLPGEMRALPEARFTCQGRGDCCTVGKWTITVSDNQRVALHALTQATGDTLLRVSGDASDVRMGDPMCTAARHQLAAGAPGKCHQLDPAGHCRIHGGLGWQAVAPCQLYPYRIVGTPDGYDVTALHSCMTVARNEGAPIGRQEADLRGRVWPYQHRLERIGETVPLTRDGEARLTWPAYRRLEADLLACLAQLDQDGVEALLRGNRLLSAQLGLARTGEHVAVNALLQPIIDDPQAAIRQPPWLGGGGRVAWETPGWRQVRLIPDGAVARYLRTVLFRKVGLADIGVAFPWFLALLAWRLLGADAAYRAWRQGRVATSAQDWLAAIPVGEMILAHGAYAEGWAQGIPAAFESPATWRQLAEPLGPA